MKPMKIIGAGGVLAILIAITALGLTYSDASGSRGVAPTGPLVAEELAALTSEGIAPQRAEEEIEVEQGVGRAKLLSKLEGALGESFGGAWYEPAAAQLHVGVTSPTGRRLAEELAERAGLDGDVTASSVRWTLADLKLAQSQWSQRFAGFFEREEIGSFLRPSLNAVVVRIGSNVSDADRAELTRAAAGYGGKIEVEGVSYPMRMELEVGRCEAWSSGKAYCDPTLTGGVTIVSASGRISTAGPTVVLKNISEDTTGTYLLVAGHAIENAGGLKSKFFAFSKMGVKEEIGEAIAFLTGAKKNSADAGLIRIENPFWKGAALTPIIPAIAVWGATESEPFTVKSTVLPTEGGNTCVSGQTTGSHCGVVEGLEGIIGNVKELAVVKSVTATAKGDSGSPWYSEAGEKQVEGITIGKVGGQSAFQTLGNTFKYLLEEAKISLQILTEFNETRPNCPMN